MRKWRMVIFFTAGALISLSSFAGEDALVQAFNHKDAHSESKMKISDPPAATYRWQDKLKRGSINVVTSIVEIPRHIHERTEKDSLMAGWTIGIVEGFGYGIVRFGAGVLDVLTCPFDFPKDKKAPIIDPEYVWQNSDVKFA